MAPIMSFDSFDLTDFVINKGNGVKGLSDLGLKSLPKQYIQPQEALINIIRHESIPVINMSNWDNDPKIADSICDPKDATHLFFGLPAEVKNKYSKEFSSTNNVRFGTSFRPDAEKALEWKDYLSLFYVAEDKASALWPSACKNQLQHGKEGLSVSRLLQLAVARSVGPTNCAPPNKNNREAQLEVWLPLPANCYKANIDDAVRKDGVGCGIIIQNCMGQVMVSAGRPLPICPSIFSVELQAILFGLPVACDCGFLRLHIESDAAMVIQHLLPEETPMDIFSFLVDDSDTWQNPLLKFLSIKCLEKQMP